MKQNIEKVLFDSIMVNPDLSGNFEDVKDELWGVPFVVTRNNRAYVFMISSMLPDRPVMHGAFDDVESAKHECVRLLSRRTEYEFTL